MSTLILKFGGLSVGMTTGMTQLLSIVLHQHERWDRLLLVVSALDGVTDQLLEAAHLALLNNQRGYRRLVATIRTRHLALIEHLPLGAPERAALQADIDRLLFDMLATYESMNANEHVSAPEWIDRVIGTGERLAARIVAALLRQNKLRGVAIDATNLIITDSAFGGAQPDFPRTREQIDTNLLPLVERGIVPVITGFIGATPDGKPTTLGRGGSDYTASILAVCSDADEVWVLTDVDGMMSADPRELSDARVIPSLSYSEVAELAYFGARILHARMIAPLRERRIPLRVRNVFKPQLPGTFISDAPTQTGFKAVTSIQGLGMRAHHSGSLAALAALAALVDQRLAALTGIHTDVMISSQSSEQSFVTFVIPTSAGPDALHSLHNALETELSALAQTTPWVMQPVTVITVIGARVGDHHAQTARLLVALDGIELLALAQSPARSSVSFVVKPDDADSALARLHTLIIAEGNA